MRARVTTILVAILAILPLAIVAMAYASNGATIREVEVNHMRELLSDSAENVATTTEQYVEPLIALTQTAAHHLDAGILAPDDPVVLEQYLRTTLAATDRLEAIGWYGDDATALEVRRSGDRYISRWFDPAAESPVVEATIRTTSGTVVTSSLSTGVLEINDPVLVTRAGLGAPALSAPILLADGETFGVTIAAAGAGGGAVLADLDLDDLGAFIAAQSPSASSRVFVVGGNQIVAHARPEILGDAAVGAALDDVTDTPTAVAAQTASGGDGWTKLTIDDVSYQSATAGIENIAGLHWTVVVVGPESDFTDEFVVLRRKATAQLSALALIAIVLAIPLARLAVRDVGSLRDAAHRDSLTGLLNRRTFEKRGTAMVAAGRRRRRSVGAIMIDIDHFKQLNDTYGHHAGDEILEAVSGRIAHSVAKSDLVARLGGDELGLLLENADLAASRSVAARLKNAVTATPISTHRGPVYVTVSLGAAATGGLERARFEDVLKAADRALYASKRGGRDRITAVDVARTH